MKHCETCKQRIPDFVLKVTNGQLLAYLKDVCSTGWTQWHYHRVDHLFELRRDEDGQKELQQELYDWLKLRVEKP